MPTSTHNQRSSTQGASSTRGPDPTDIRLIDLMPAAVYTCDPAGRITYYNKRAQELWGRAPRLGDSDQKFCGSFRLYHRNGDPLPHDETPMAATLKSGKPHHNYEVIIERPNDSTITVLVNIDPLFDERGNLTGAINVFQDITERKRAEKERERLLGELEKERAQLRELKATLETRIVQRTLQVRELAAALTIAEQRERARISQVLHDDLQQLLYSQLMRVEMLRQELGEEQRPEVSELLAGMTEQLEEAVHVTRVLTAELNPPTVKTGDLQEALHWLAGHIEDAHNLRVTIHGDVSGLNGRDDTRDLLLQMIRELLFNVVKHADAQQAAIHVARDGDDLVVQVEDRGAGFNLRKRKKSLAEQDGLGLFSISNRLELIGGRMEINSAPGQGTCVTIVIPLE